MKKEKGITLISLTITVVIIIILAAVATNYGMSSIQNAHFQNFNYELQQVKGKVDVIYEKIKLGDESYITLGNNITESEDAVNTLKTLKDIDYENISEEDRDKYYKDEDTTYRFLGENEIQETFEITSNPGDLIINFLTREVISVEGYEYEGKIYYTLEDFGKMIN